MKKVVFTGCSFTAGAGWSSIDPVNGFAKDYPGLWVNLCHREISKLKKLELVNAGISGASNTDIFEATVKEIGNHNDIDTIICQWTAMPRYRFSLGLELWPTSERIQGRASRLEFDVNLSNGTTWSRKYLNDLFDRFLVLHHLHGEILKVVRYSNILKKLSKKINIKLYFVNGLCPWDQNYFVRLNSVSPEDYTPFTKKTILEIESRDDDDIFKLYKNIHDDYDQVGGIDPTDWINLYDSMLKNQIDTNYDNDHPGTKSNQLSFELVKKFLESNTHPLQ